MPKSSFYMGMGWDRKVEAPRPNGFLTYLYDLGGMTMGRRDNIQPKVFVESERCSNRAKKSTVSFFT